MPPQASRIAYGNKGSWRIVTLDGAMFEKSGTMSGGGSKPRGGKMGTAIRTASVSAEAMATAEKELSDLVESLGSIRTRIADAVKCYHVSEKAISKLEMDLAKGQKEVAFDVFFLQVWLFDNFSWSSITSDFFHDRLTA